MSFPWADRLAALTAALAAQANAYDLSGAWPEAALAAYGAAGGWGWVVPRAYGGTELSSAERLETSIAVARGDVSTALYLTQHNDAVHLLADCADEGLKAQVLPACARGEHRTTIGYSQLTTSLSSGAQALRARSAPDGSGWVLDGVMPWVTGALHCNSVLAGATCPDGQQVLLLLPLPWPGVAVAPALDLLALNSTQTSRVRCTAAAVPDARRVAGPVPHVLGGRPPKRLLHVSATGIGLLQGICDQLREEEQRPVPGEAAPAAVLATHTESLRARMQACERGADTPATHIDALRSEINAVLLRAAGALLTLAKGTGYLRSHPAQRLAREALFFCVWSANESVRTRTLARLLEGLD